MLYTVGDNAVDYTIYSKTDSYPEILDLIFTVGCAEKVMYVNEVSLTEGSSIKEAAEVLTEFCKTFKSNCIIYSLESTQSSVNNVAMRFVLHEVGFYSLKKFIDDDTATLFVYLNTYTNAIYTKLFDEFISFELTDMLTHSVTAGSSDKDYDRLHTLLKRLGKEKSLVLKDQIDKFFGIDSTNGPKKMNL